jgi:hypothetical protein
MSTLDRMIAGVLRASLCAATLVAATTFAQDNTAAVEAPVVRTNSQRFDLNVEDAPARAFFM